MKLKKSRIVYSLLAMFLLTAVMAVYGEPVSAESDVTLLSDSSYIADSEVYYIVGEVKNTGDTPVRFVKITATYYDSNDNVLVNDYGYSTLDILLPNVKSSFEIVLMNEADVQQIDHYTLAVTYSEAPSTPEQALSILSNTGFVSSTGAIRIIGEIQNSGTETSTYTIIYATFYDVDGKAVANDLTFPDPQDMPAGTTDEFDLLYVDYDRVPMIESYTLTAESYEYAVVSDVSGSITATSPTPDPTPTPSVPESPIVAVLAALLIASICSMLLLKGKIGQKQ